MGKDVTTKIKALLKKHGSKSNMNFRTKPSKKKIRKTVRKGKVKGGGWHDNDKAISKGLTGGSKQTGGSKLTGGWNMKASTK